MNPCFGPCICYVYPPCAGPCHDREDPYSAAMPCGCDHPPEMRLDRCMKNGLSAFQLKISDTLRQLWIEHVMWTRSFIISTAFGLPDLDAVTARLLRNPNDFADVLEHFYGLRIAAEFQRLLTDHLLIAAELVNAAKAGNLQEVQNARTKWYANAKDIAYFLSDINPHWSRAIWITLLDDHLNMTENEAVQILSGKYEASIAEYDKIEAEALKMADYMTCGIIEQFMIR